MANYTTLKAAIQQVVKTNGNNEITGALLQQSLLAMINSLGGYYQFAGVATPSTNPGTPDQNIFYIAGTAGTYSNFGSLSVSDGEVAILKYNGTWTKEVTGAATAEELKQLGVQVSVYFPEWEIGNISISLGGWAFWNSTTRVRLKQGTTIHLFPGDVVGLTSYASATYYIGWLKEDGTYGTPQAWQTKDFKVTEEGDYVFCLRYAPESTVSAANDLGGLFFVKSIRQRVESLEEKVTLPAGLVPVLEFERGKYCNYDGTLVANADWAISGKIPMTAGDTIVWRAGYDVDNFYISMCFFDSNGRLTEYISKGLASATERTRTLTNPDTAYGVASFYLPAADGYLYLNNVEIITFNDYAVAMLDIANNGVVGRGFTKGVNHRGYNVTAPENTLPAFKLSRKNGFEYVETDVRFTSDGVAVLLHDASINRTARDSDGNELSSTVNIADISYADALTYDFGIYKGSTYAGTIIPTFEEFIVLCRNIGLKPYIELKVGTQAQIEALVDVVKKHGMTDKTSWISFDSSLLGYVTAYEQTARVGFLITTITADKITTVQALQTGSNEVFIDSSTYTDSEIALCAAAGLPLEVWTIDTLSTIEGLDGYISGVTSNSVDASVAIYDAEMN